jgi:glycerol kinase
MTYVIAIDAGTTSVRARALRLDDPDDVGGRWAQRELTQHFPAPDRVEHDADEIWRLVVDTVSEVLHHCGARNVAAIGITNQRETLVAWNRTTGRPYGRAIVWQDRRTASRCDELRAQDVEPWIRERTGLVLDPYFSGTKAAWLISEGNLPVDADLALGTVDSWILWNLTGGKVLATEPSNASRTLLFDLHTGNWSDELAAVFGVPLHPWGEVRPSSGRFGVTDAVSGLPGGLAISGIAGDQQAALFGQGCWQPGMAKNTYGTGSFVLMNVGSSAPAPVDGLLTTVAWNRDGLTTYALEGSVFSSGSAIQWLRDGLGIIDAAADTGPLADSVASSDGVMIVPAFNGLGSPWWDPYARGTVVGITRGTTRAHLARAVVEAMALQTQDVLDAMVEASGASLRELRVDGGASVMDLLIRLQATLAQVPVRRPSDLETTSRGAAQLAGWAEGVWAPPAATLDPAAAPTGDGTVFLPDPVLAAALPTLRLAWSRAVQRASHWATGASDVSLTAPRRPHRVVDPTP